jgi:hypothetical protein
MLHKRGQLTRIKQQTVLAEQEVSKSVRQHAKENALSSLGIQSHFAQMTRRNGGTGIAPVGTATGYGLDGPRIESPWGRDFPYQSRPSLGTNYPPIQWVPGLSWGG